MNNAKPKYSNNQLYSEYFIESVCYPNKDQLSIFSKIKNHNHKLNASQTSSYSIKQIKGSLNKNKNRSLNKLFVYNAVQLGQKTKDTQKKQSFDDKLKYSTKKQKQFPTKKQKLKIDTIKKSKLKIMQNLTSRSGNIQFSKENQKLNSKLRNTEQSISAFQCNLKNQRVISLQNKLNHSDNSIASKLKIKEKSMKLMIQKCEKVMTEYQEQLTFLKRQNELLKFQNMELKKKTQNFHEVQTKQLH